MNSIGYVLRFLKKLCRSLLCDNLFSNQPFQQYSAAPGTLEVYENRRMEAGRLPDLLVFRVQWGGGDDSLLLVLSCICWITAGPRGMFPEGDRWICSIFPGWLQRRLSVENHCVREPQK